MRHPEGSVGDERSGVHLWAVSCFLTSGSPFVEWLVRAVRWFFLVVLPPFAVCSLASDISCCPGISYGLQGEVTVVAEDVLSSRLRGANTMCQVGFVSQWMAVKTTSVKDFTHMRQRSETSFERQRNYGYRCLLEGLSAPRT